MIETAKRPEVFGLEEGVNEIFRLFKEAGIRPYIVSIHGFPNSGKSYISNELIKRCRGAGLNAINACEPNIAKQMIDDYGSDYFSLMTLNEAALFPKLIEEDLKKAIGRGQNLSILINNPLIYDLERMYVMDRIYPYFDLEVLNPESTVKRLPRTYF